MSTSGSPRPAASVILCRNPEDPEVFWVRRQDYLSFLGGFHVFPGGRMSRSDDPAAFGPKAPDAPADLPLRLCAVRELFEETGVLLARPAGAGPAGTASRVGDFREALAAASLVPDYDSLLPAGRWLTPPFSPARFDTVFYLAWAPEEARPGVHAGELAEGEWIRPEAALDRWSAGRALLAPPTLYALRGLYAAALEVESGMGPLTLQGAVEHLTGAPEAEGGAVTRIEMRPGFFLFPMKTHSLPPATHTNAFLVGGGAMVLIDPGSGDPGEVERLLTFIDKLGTEGRGVAEIWLTHHHPDHVGGVEAVAKALNVPVRAHPLTAARLEGSPVPVEAALHEGLIRNLPGQPGWRLRVVHTPGHAPGHISILEEKAGTLITGDLVAGTGYVMIDPPEGDMGQYMRSLERLRTLGASALFPSHGPPTAGVEARLLEYIAHRVEREAKVLAALAAGEPRGLEEMVPEVYSDVDGTLHALASRSLLAHLLKLEKEGKVRRAGDRYRAVTEGSS